MAVEKSDFTDVFEREDRDSGADSAAPEAKQQDVPRDELGRFAQKSEPDQQPQPEMPAEAAPQQQQPNPDERTPRHVPLTELMSEREKRKLEAQRREDAERERDSMRAQIQAYERMMQTQRSQPAPQAQPAPDPYADPEGFAAHQREQSFVTQRNQIANMSEAWATRQYGEKLVNEARDWAIRTGMANRFFLEARDPYGDLVDTYKRAQALQRIGDPEKYESEVEKRVREKVLAELKAGKPAPKFPGSLAGETQAGSQGEHLSIEAVANELFNTNRNRRAYS